MSEINQTPIEKEVVTNPNEIVSKSKLMEASTYFGHKTSNWNPKMKPYIHTKKRGIHLIDIAKTQKTLEFAYQLVKKYAERNANFIFVGTPIKARTTMKENALRTNSSYATERWLGGTLTNNRTIFGRVKRMEQLEKLAEAEYPGYTKKEGVLLQRELDKLIKNLSGIRNMRRSPNVMIVSNPKADAIAIKEARKLGVKVIGMVDSNTDPSLVDVIIPANDDSSKSINIIITILADAIAEVKNGEILYAYKKDDQIVLPEEVKTPRALKKGRRFDSYPRKFERNADGKPTYTKREDSDGKPAYTKREDSDGKPAYTKREDSDGKPAYVKREVLPKTVKTEEVK